MVLIMGGNVRLEVGGDRGKTDPAKKAVKAKVALRAALAIELVRESAPPPAPKPVRALKRP
jgi:hypothetical protein